MNFSALAGPAAEASFNRCTHTAVANEVLLQQILQNLLDNAAKYSRPGVIPKIEVWSESQGDVVRLTIADNGIGIARTDQERLFRIFLNGLRLPPATRWESVSPWSIGPWRKSTCPPCDGELQRGAVGLVSQHGSLSVS